MTDRKSPTDYFCFSPTGRDTAATAEDRMSNSSPGDPPQEHVVETPPPEIIAWFKEQYRKHERIRQFGHVRPLFFADHAGYRFVPVGSRVYRGKNWRTFPDFLHPYCRLVLGKDWHAVEREKTVAAWHPIVQWDQAAREFRKRYLGGLKVGEMASAVATGPVMAHAALAYDLYLLENDGLLRPEMVLSECVIDLADARGTMRIALKSAALPDLAALSQSFWRARA